MHSPTVVNIYYERNIAWPVVYIGEEDMVPSMEAIYIMMEEIYLSGDNFNTIC